MDLDSSLTKVKRLVILKRLERSTEPMSISVWKIGFNGTWQHPIRNSTTYLESVKIGRAQ